ncbi:AAEL011964-PA [Aedes aegypti]|uniref:Uncharacterized protein n=2 Tax=Aedes aegypti TaxID=7159 RepID=Q16NI4_AEDAE|nr:zinc finger protein 70 [Aedes aegypti]XP_021706179.1 zinc finger protein 70 [Aedes aegypti]XP_021706180.1 zinc finger protein 70 [Aedes aegypti]EAT35910.1 AAEL011964-PA [Aedes aegypti]
MYICRVCLAQDRPLYVPLFSLQGERSVAKTIMLCTGLKLKRNDGLTQYACGQCVDEFVRFFKLKELCLESDAFLRAHIPPSEAGEDFDEASNDFGSDVDISRDGHIETLDEPLQSTIVIEEIRITEAGGEPRVITEEWVVEVDDAKHNLEVLEDPPSNNDRIESPELKSKPKASSRKRKTRRKSKPVVSSADPSKYICCSCPSEAFDSQEKLDIHRADQHEKYRVKTSTIRPFECDVCYQRFLTEKHLTQHKNRPYRKRRFVCTSCGAAFLASSTLKKHEETCTTTVCNYECNECGKHFLQSGSLRNHMKLHTSDKTHSCPICGKTFMKRFEVPIHLVTHTTEQPFVCDKCPARFKRMQALRNHQRHHSNPNPYKCDQCEEWFNSFSARKFHRQKVHEGIEPFRCEKCGASYGRQSRLTHHMRKAHPDGAGK